MSAEIYKKVRANPRFDELVRKRTRFAMLLSAMVLVTYYVMMMIVAFAPDVLRTPLSEGSTLTIGVPVGAFIIIGSWLLTGWYVKRSNGEFDDLNNEIIRESHK